MGKAGLLILFGFSGGAMVAAGVFAFLAAIGIVPRMAKRTRTQKYLWMYEDAIVLGGVFGTTAMFVEYHLPHSAWMLSGVGLLFGIFVGVLAMALTEVLNVMPILMRRIGLQKGLQWLILAFALGKVFGSFLYFFIDGFYVM